MSDTTTIMARAAVPGARGPAPSRATLRAAAARVGIALGLLALATACTDATLEPGTAGGSAAEPHYNGGVPSGDAGPGSPDALVAGGDDAATDSGSGAADADGTQWGPADTASGEPDGADGTVPSDALHTQDAGVIGPTDAATPAEDAAVTPLVDAATPPPVDVAAPPPEDVAAPPPEDVQGSVCAACGPDQVCAGDECLPACQGSCACVPGPDDCPNPPAGGQIPGAVTPDAYDTLEALAGQSKYWPACEGGDELACHLFLRAATRHLYEQDPNWGLLTKVPGQNQCSSTACGNGVSCGYAVDAIIYRATNQVVDIIVAIGSPGASVAWQLVGKLDYNHWAPPPCVSADAGPAPPETLASGASLAPGEALLSADGRFRLEYQADGDLVLTYVGVDVLWSTGTKGAPGSVSMQGDGNLVVYDAGGAAIWASGTGESPGASLLLQSDGNAVIYATDGAAVWSTDTCCY